MTAIYDPFAPMSSRLALAGSTPVSADSDPSRVGVRPFGLRRARAVPAERRLPTWFYDHVQQVAVDVATGLPLCVVMEGDPSATTTSTTDGEDGPSSEDWDND